MNILDRFLEYARIPSASDEESSSFPSTKKQLKVCELLVKQLKEAISCYCDEVLCYQYMGMMNKPGTIAFCGHPGSIEYYRAYKKMIDEKVK